MRTHPSHPSAASDSLDRLLAEAFPHGPMPKGFAEHLAARLAPQAARQAEARRGGPARAWWLLPLGSMSLCAGILFGASAAGVPPTLPLTVLAGAAGALAAGAWTLMHSLGLTIGLGALAVDVPLFLFLRARQEVRS